MCGCNDGCDDCIPLVTLCVPRGDERMVIFDVRDAVCGGELVDISDVSEIVIAAYDEIGGVNRIVKRLSTGGVTISTNGYQFYTVITSADSGSLVRENNYFEARVLTAAGAPSTVCKGLLLSPYTMNKDL